MVAWQLDPFGHSSGLANLFAEIGFDATFFARMNIEEAKQRKLERDLEFVWSPSFVSADDSEESILPKEILAHMLFDHYNPPSFVTPSFYNSSRRKVFTIESKINWFQYFDSQVEAYRTRNVIVLWGDDFTHKYASVSLGNAKQII